MYLQSAQQLIHAEESYVLGQQSKFPKKPTALDLLWGKSDIPGLGLRKGEPPARAPGMAALAVNRMCQGALCAGQDAPSPTEHRMRLGLGAGEGFCWEDL